jgi:hypothetical protein
MLSYQMQKLYKKVLKNKWIILHTKLVNRSDCMFIQIAMTPQEWDPGENITLQIWYPKETRVVENE